MILLSLITCIVLRALSAQAKVVPDFNKCEGYEKFFYKGIEPKGMDQNAAKICQMLKNEESEETIWYSSMYYATLYSVRHKIPLYSAYTLDRFCSIDNGRPQKWHLEPQISHKESEFVYMVPENKANQELYKVNQSISSDYCDSGYDRGHLNPSSFQSGDRHTATYTLTNAAPMDAYFNRIHWKNWESALRRYLLEKLESDLYLATAFIVTGTVPDPGVWISHVDSDDPERVSVPSHIWTAVCYKHNSDDTKSISFGYIGRNQPESDIRLMSVSDLNDELSRLYSEISATDSERYQIESSRIHEMSVSDLNRELLRLYGMISATDTERYQRSRIHEMSVSDLNHELRRLHRKFPATRVISTSRRDSGVMFKLRSIEIFADGCFGDYNKLNKVQVAFHKLINLPVNKAVQMSSDIQNTYLAVKRTVGGDSTPKKRARVNDMTAKLAFDSMSTYYSQTEDLKIFTGSACLITNVEPQVWPSDDKPLKTDSVVCLLVPEKQKTAADGSRCSSVTESDDSCQCNTGGETKPCCSSPCLYQDDLDGYRCYSGQELIDCSPRYSLITHNGERCLDDHPCATYGYDYYWCKTSHEVSYNWDYCSPPLRYSETVNEVYCRSNHACGTYGYSYIWCYTDNEGNWDYC